MALNKMQYESIIKGYERTRDRNRHLASERHELIYNRIPGYKELSESVADISASLALAVINGEEGAMDKVRTSLRAITERKHKMLQDFGYPADYLEPIYDCTDCKDTGFLSDANSLKTKCHCFRNQEIELLYDQSNIREVIAAENFNSLSYQYYQGEDLDRFEKAVDICKNFVQNFVHDYHNLFFYGTVGTGKSFLSSCIAKELIDKGQLVIYFSATQLFDALSKSTFDKESKEAASGIYEDIYECDLLIIDDLGTELTNAFVSSQLFSCLNNRHLRKKSTIITTNLSLEELRDRYSDRIFSRITSNYGMCKLTGRDIRVTKKLLLNRK